MPRAAILPKARARQQCSGYDSCPSLGSSSIAAGSRDLCATHITVPVFDIQLQLLMPAFPYQTLGGSSCGLSNWVPATYHMGAQD